MIKLYALWLADRILHLCGHLECKYVWAHRICNKFATLADEMDRWDLA